MNFFEQGIPLGRWFGIRVIIHWLFVIYAGFMIFQDPQPGWAAFEIALLFGTVLAHEFGHSLSCIAVGGESPLIILWPLGGIAFVRPPNNVRAWFISTVCGPLVNAILWPAFWAICKYFLPWFDANSNPAFLSTEIVDQGCKFMRDINEILLLFNLIPAYPMDGGRIVQEILWMILGYQRSLQIAGMIGTVAGAGFVVVGLGVRDIDIAIYDFHLHLGKDPFLIAIGVLCAMQSWAIYVRSQEIESWRKR